jgi:hypothetical protein
VALALHEFAKPRADEVEECPDTIGLTGASEIEGVDLLLVAYCAL